MGQARLRDLYEDEWDDLWSLVARFGDDDWSHHTLCDGWSVRQVVEHVAAWDALLGFDRPAGYLYRLGAFAAVFVRAGFSMDRLNDRLQRRSRRDRSGHPIPPALCRHHLFDRTAAGSQLAELVVHHQDIRRALGRPRRIPAERLEAALAGVFRLPGVGARHRARGLRWAPDDVGWSTGEGPTVSGPGEAVLLTLAGRATAVDDLSGDGVAVLRSRQG